MTTALLLVVLAYLCGSIPTGVLLARRAGVDVRLEGSGNIGATNVARTAGRRLGILTLAGDLLKGFLPVAATRAAGFPVDLVAAVAVAAIAGHAFSVFLGFRGGKGVATGLGVLLALSPIASLVPIAVFAVVIGTVGIVSAASLAAAVTAPLALWGTGSPAPFVVAALLIAALIVFRHRENIQRLRAGTEARFRSKTPPRPTAQESSCARKNGTPERP